MADTWTTASGTAVPASMWAGAGARLLIVALLIGLLLWAIRKGK